MNTKSKKAEIKIIRGFLSFIGCKTLRVIPHEKPDAMVDIKEKGRRKKIGVEHTEYHVDAPPGKPSPGRKVHSFWHYVQSSIRRRVSHRPDIQHMTGLVFFRKNNFPNKLKARDLAGELVRLAAESSVALDDERTINKFSDKYPTLKAYVRKVSFIGTGSARCVSWECADANVSSIGVSAKELACIIRNKTKEFPKYCWGEVKERWFLISASGTTIFNSAGARPESVNWTLPEFQSACHSVGIDRIFFWDRMYNWYKEIWPGAPVVKREWRAKEL